MYQTMYHFGFDYCRTIMTLLPCHPGRAKTLELLARRYYWPYEEGCQAFHTELPCLPQNEVSTPCAVWSPTTVVGTGMAMATHLCGLCYGPTAIKRIRCHLRGGRPPDQREEPYPLYDYDYGGGIGGPLLR